MKTRGGVDPILRRVIVAGQELDAEPGGRLGWLVRFARLEAWTPEHEPLYGLRLLACGLPPIPPVIQALARPVVPLTSEEIRRLHRMLRRWFRTLVMSPPGHLVPVPTEGLEMHLLRATPIGAKPAIFALSSTGPLDTMLFQRAAEWVFQTDRLIRCPGPDCKQPFFLALRKSLFCSAPCLRKHHDQKKLAKRKREGTR